ncbi:MAG: bifunctional UDP-N-acetylglucosamine diphosphorylase/glucosamine-1-phosphate N-acetyltransferase GlmU [Acidobacteriota bacterium]|nr:bifunctional UDP-N-acetylglucosamine diphosphorylase/glucosamine-1-phosphate N-acetyltransferase GlmU [Acidobacteriota bacterium]
MASPAPSTRLAVVIMAAGKGTRLKSARAKVLHEIGGKTLLGHVIAAASKLVSPTSIFVVVGHQAERVRAAFATSGVHFVEQTEQRGTGHAVQCAREAVAGFDNVMVLSGDAPLIRPETLRNVWQFHQEHKAAMTLVSAEPAHPTGYGRIIRKSGQSAEVTGIVEQKMLTPEQESIPEVNMGLYVFRTDPLLRYLSKLSTNNPHGEFYLTDMAHVLHQAGERVAAYIAPDAAELLGANTLKEMAELDAHLRKNTAEKLMAQGVTIYKPETCVIDTDVEVAADAVIEPYVQLLGTTKIGTASRIRSYTVIENCKLGEDVLVRQSCVLADSTVANGVRIGPFAHLRPGSELGPDVHIGNFVETKKAKVGRGSKANHLTYLGDAEVGEGSNIGAGVITCNYDGVRKHTTKIGNRSFVGSDSTLVAPVTIGDDAYVAAGSCITKDVEAGALALGRAQQVDKPGWVAERRAKDVSK